MTPLLPNNVLTISSGVSWAGEPEAGTLSYRETQEVDVCAHDPTAGSSVFLVCRKIAVGLPRLGVCCRFSVVLRGSPPSSSLWRPKQGRNLCVMPWTRIPAKCSFGGSVYL